MPFTSATYTEDLTRPLAPTQQRHLRLQRPAPTLPLGSEARNAGRLPKTFRTVVGPLTLQWTYYDCAACADTACRSPASAPGASAAASGSAQPILCPPPLKHLAGFLSIPRLDLPSAGNLSLSEHQGPATSNEL